MNYQVFDFIVQTETPLTSGKYNIPESQVKPVILDQYKDINDLIDTMNDNISKIFKKQEEFLLGNCKEEMEKAQEQLKVLSELTTESELRKKMQQKREEIEKYRQMILQSSNEFSNKCKEYKESLQQVMTTTRDLEAEIEFLDYQIQHIIKQNQQLKNSLQNPSSSPLKKMNRPRNKSQNETEAIDDEIQRAQQQLTQQQQILQQMETIKNDQSLQESDIEKLFLKCVENVRKQKQKTELSNLLMQSKRPKQLSPLRYSQDGNLILPIRYRKEIQQFNDLKQYQQFEHQINNKDQFFADLDFTEQHKTQILEEFLSQDQVKIMIYNLLHQ